MVFDEAVSTTAKPVGERPAAAALTLVLVVLSLGLVFSGHIVPRVVGWLAAATGLGCALVWRAQRARVQDQEGETSIPPALWISVALALAAAALVAFHAWGIALRLTA